MFIKYLSKIKWFRKITSKKKSKDVLGNVNKKKVMLILDKVEFFRIFKY